MDGEADASNPSNENGRLNIPDFGYIPPGSGEGSWIQEVPNGGGTDSYGITWEVDDYGTARIVDTPAGLQIVDGENGRLHVFLTDPGQIQELIDAGADTEFGLYDDSGRLTGLYLGTYEVDGERLIFTQNPAIPLGLIDFSNPPQEEECSYMWMWFLIGLLTLPWLWFAVLKRRKKREED